MAEETRIETPDNPYDKPERFAWLIREYEKHIRRFEASRRSMDQKSIWALATASGFVGFVGLVKGESIGAVLYSRFTNQVVDIDITQKIMILTAMLFALTYLLLLVKVIGVYFPKKVIYPIMPTNFRLGQPVSYFEDEAKNAWIGEQYWYLSVDRFIKPSDIDNFHLVLRQYIDAIIEQFLQNQKMGEELSFAFQLLPPMAIMAISLFVLG